MKTITPGARLKQIRDIMDSVDRRCLAADGAASQLQDEVTDAELRRIYRLTEPAPKRGKR